MVKRCSYSGEIKRKLISGDYKLETVSPQCVSGCVKKYLLNMVENVTGINGEKS